MRILPCVLLVLTANALGAQRRERDCRPGDDGKRDIPIVAGQTYADDDLTKCASPDYEVKPPYPAALRAHNKTGGILVRFVIDTSGKADMETFSVVRTTDSLLIETAQRAIERSKYHPAEIRGTKVRSWSSKVFNFEEGTAREKLPVRVRPD